MAETTVLDADADANELMFAKAMGPLIEKRERLVRMIAHHKAQAISDQDALAQVDSELLPALNAAYAGRGWTKVDAVVFARDDSRKATGLKFTHS